MDYAGINQDLEKIRHAGEKTFEENLTRPMQPQVNAVRNLINGNQNERPDGREIGNNIYIGSITVFVI